MTAIYSAYISPTVLGKGEGIVDESEPSKLYDILTRVFS